MMKRITRTNVNHSNRSDARGGRAFARSWREEGQSMVEFALLMPIFVLIIVGSAEFAHFAWSTVLATSAARAGSQYGAQTRVSASDNAGMQTAATNDATNVAGLSTTPSHFCTCSTAASTQITCNTALTTCPSPATVLEFVQVNTAVTVYPLGNYPGLPTSFTARGTSIVQVLQ